MNGCKAFWRIRSQVHVLVYSFFEGIIEISCFSGSVTVKAIYGTTCATNLNNPETLGILRNLKLLRFLSIAISPLSMDLWVHSMEPALRIANIDKLTKKRKTLKWKGKLLHNLVHFLPFVQGCMKIKEKPEEFMDLAK